MTFVNCLFCGVGKLFVSCDIALSWEILPEMSHWRWLGTHILGIMNERFRTSRDLWGICTKISVRSKLNTFIVYFGRNYCNIGLSEEFRNFPADKPFFPRREIVHQWIEAASVGGRPSLLLESRSQWYTYSPSEEQIYDIAKSRYVTILYLADLGLILHPDKPGPVCTECDLNMQFRADKFFIDGYFWCCPNKLKKKKVERPDGKFKRVSLCTKTKSVREGSIFSRAKFGGGLCALLVIIFKYTAATPLKWQPQWDTAQTRESLWDNGFSG